MTADSLRYDRMVERALRGVVREALSAVAERGLPGDHHFYLTFSTQDPGVDIPPYLRDQYPEEMTIVLQYQYYNLEVDDDRFRVTLSFRNKHEPLSIPFAAITTFADPSVNFALQFQPLAGQEARTDEPDTADEREAEAPVLLGRPAGGEGDGAERGGDDKVVPLDSFRKK